MLAVVTMRSNEVGRHYRLPESADYDIVQAAQRGVAELPTTDEFGISPVPNEPLPPEGTLGFRVQKYGMATWGDLFTARQKLALVTVARAVRRCAREHSATHDVLALALSRLTDIFNASCRWENTKNQARNLFTRHALPIIWDFAETSLLGAQAGDYTVTLNTMADVLAAGQLHARPATVELADACSSTLRDQAANIWFVDPPYYDAIPYSDLSDFFFVWLKRVLPGHPLLRDIADPGNPLTPKVAEIVQDESKRSGGRPKDRAFFETAMARAFAEGRRVTHDNDIGAVVFAHKTTEGWEALLSGLIQGGWIITGSWPIATESANRPRARESAALATSVHLVCRPRQDRRVGDWGEVLRELPGRVGDWMERLQAEEIRGADLVFACIGPALEIFSRYEHVETAEGTLVPLSEYLAKVWEVVGRIALEQILGTAEARARNGLAGVLEEDARLTALFLWTLQSEFDKSGTPDDDDTFESTPDDDEAFDIRPTRGITLPSDVVRRFAQPLGIHLDAWEGRIIESHKGAVRLLPVAERSLQLFGEADTSAIAAAIERDHNRAAQLDLFPEPQSPPRLRVSDRGKPRPARPYAGQVTTLDRVHAAMLLQRGGQTNALRALLRVESERGNDFGRLANALSALYPMDAEEKRLLDAMLLAMPR